MSKYFKKFVEAMKQNVQTEQFESGQPQKELRKAERAEVLKEALNLKTLREMSMTPDSRLRSFRRMVLKERRTEFRSYYSNDRSEAEKILYENFYKEAVYLKGMEADSDKHVKLSKEISKLSDMTDEQIQCYYTLVPEFKECNIGRINIYYAKYYALEVANQIYQSTPLTAYQTLFDFWDALVKAKKRTYQDEYLNQLCNVFMIAHPDLMPMIVDAMRNRGCFSFDSRIYEEIADGEYKNASIYVQHEARLLKEEEITGTEDYCTATWKAMPYVFRSLSDVFTECAVPFQQVILKGHFHNHSVRTLAMKHLYTNYNHREISAYEYFEWNKYSGGWDKNEYLIDECVQDFLNIIHLYTESFLRERYQAKGKRKRSATRVLNKQYIHVVVDRKNLTRIKEILNSTEFEDTIERGIDTYIEQEQVIIPQKEVKSTYQEEIYQMDHAVIQEVNPKIDLKKLHKARKDADSLLGLLHTEEINYDTAGLMDMKDNVSQPDTSASKQSEKTTEETSQNLFTETEKDYLLELIDGQSVKASELAQKSGIPERVMMKKINEKVFGIFSDVVLEIINNRITVVEDYVDQLNKILG